MKRLFWGFGCRPAAFALDVIKNKIKKIFKIILFIFIDILKKRCYNIIKEAKNAKNKKQKIKSFRRLKKMKFKTTQKKIKENYAAIISIGYCDAWYLLYFNKPIAFTSGVYGWNADIYDVNNIAIVTGYRPFGNIHVDFDIIKKYNNEAKNIISNNAISYEDKKELVNNLLLDFKTEVLKK